MKPTKFEIMRWNRSAANARATWVVPAAPAPAVPVMEVGGELYREASTLGRSNDCKGCEYPGHLGCAPAWRAAEAAFGGNCEARRVIYIRAE
jgi:hypothetical protein